MYSERLPSASIRIILSKFALSTHLRFLEFTRPFDRSKFVELTFDFKNFQFGFLFLSLKLLVLKELLVEMVMRVFIFHLKVIGVNFSNLQKKKNTEISLTLFEAKNNLKFQPCPYFEHTLHPLYITADLHIPTILLYFQLDIS